MNAVQSTTKRPLRRVHAIAAAMFALFGAMTSSSAQAFGVLDAYRAALENDATYRSARYEQEAGKEYAALGRSNLLPVLSASYGATRNRADITTRSTFGGENTIQPEYISRNTTLSLRQPLINLDGLARYREGVAQSRYSDAVFVLRKQEVVLRVFSAYAEAQYAEEQLGLALAQRDAYAEQRRVNDRLFEKGEGTRTDMLETQARLDLAEAQVIEARDAVANGRAALQAVVGRSAQSDGPLDALSPAFRVASLAPQSFDDWRATALANNPDILAARLAAEAARLEIERNRAGHAPRLDLVASVGKSDSDTINSFNQSATVRAVGVQLTLPIYSGGYVNAATRQAAANYEKSRADLDAKIDQVMLDLRRQHAQALSSAARIDALQKSVDAAQLLIEATRQSIKGGVRINLDLLNAQQQLTRAKGDLALARYTWLLSSLRLKAAAGVLDEADLQRTAAYFIASR